ncbi:MAG: glycosyltransferase family 2 protein [Myxococcota bacterium]
MHGGLRVAVVVPAHDEARLIDRTLDAVPCWVDRVVVVDDGSRDGTSRRVVERREARVRLLRHRLKRGVGAAIATGYDAAFAEGCDVAVVMAGDAQMHPGDLGALLAPLVRGEAGYVKGDRTRWPDVARHMPRSRLLGTRVLARATAWATGLPVRDSQCGYTALGRRAAARIDLSALWPGYGYPNDLLAALARAGVTVAEVPVRPVYGDERSGLGLRHAVLVIPFLLLRAAWRRQRGALRLRRLA